MASGFPDHIPIGDENSISGAESQGPWIRQARLVILDQPDQPPGGLLADGMPVYGGQEGRYFWIMVLHGFRHVAWYVGLPRIPVSGFHPSSRQGLQVDRNKFDSLQGEWCLDGGSRSSEAKRHLEILAVA